jgi:hypothetical protein
MGQNLQIKPEDHPSVIIIRIKSLEKLHNTFLSIINNDIKAFPFFESLFENQMTAFATAPLTENQQFLLKKYQLIKESDFCQKETPC